MDVSKIIGAHGDKVIDRAAEFAKDKIDEAFGGGQDKDKRKDKAGGIGGKVTDAITKAAADQAADSAADQALSFGKKLFQ